MKSTDRARALRARVPGLVCFLTLLLPGAPAQAQRAREAHVRVTVEDLSGATVAGAKVDLLNGQGAVEERISDGRGGAELALPAGKYRLAVSCAGFAAVEQPVEVRPGGSFAVTVTMRPGGGSETVEVGAEGLSAKVAESATRMPMSVLETPQQVQVLTGELLRSRAVESMKQAVEMAPAVGLQLGEGRRDNFFIRGFNAVSDMYIDGVRDDAQYYRDLSNTERIEVVEGPAAVLYGRGSSGGLINRVTKKPRMEGTFGELAFTHGSYGENRGAADVDTVVPHTAGKVGFRLTGAAENEGSQRHFYWGSRYTFAPTLTWKLSESTTVTAQVERLRDDRLPDRGIPYIPAGHGALSGRPAPVSVGNYYGYVGPQAGSNFIHSAVTDGTVVARHSFGDGWELRATQRVAGYATNFANMYATSVTAATNGDFLVGRGEYHGAQRWQLSSTNVEGYRTFSALHLQHTLLLGGEYGREATEGTQYTGPTNQTPVSLRHPANLPPVLSAVLSRNNRFLAQTNALYAQDLVAAGTKWKALLGVRVDDFRQALELRPPTNTTPDFGRTDYAASPRVGLVYQARPWVSVYGNYSRTFSPSGENLSLAVNNAQLKPEVTQNYEAGAKAQVLGSRLLLTASVFRLDRTNIKTTDPNDPTALLNLGEQRTDGAELNAQGMLARNWQVYGGYAWLDGRIVSSTTLSNGVSLQGRRPAMTPLHAASLWTTYQFDGRFRMGRMNLNGLMLGGGMIAKDVQFAATDNLAKLPRYARLDVMATYRRARYEIQANVQNANNIRYFDAAQTDFQIYPSAPVNAAVSVRYRFWRMQ
ncbi:MAG TPA: TonB-dependent siderophore receptor [Acidobacteriaceae bacterium]|jgi:catecholate siderophore receptor|nr:TonB-dependent siderophore receptor [Acidobacteriaceae bacterium]